jgi:hypothetical protein
MLAATLDSTLLTKLTMAGASSAIRTWPRLLFFAPFANGTPQPADVSFSATGTAASGRRRKLTANPVADR